MGDVLVENPVHHAQTLKKNTPSTIPSIENFEGASTEGGDEYATLKRLQRQLEYIQLQEEYIKDEQRYLHHRPTTLGQHRLTLVQEPEARASASTRRDQENPECSLGDRPVYGSH